MHYTSKEVYEYISKQMNDPIVGWKTCAVSGTEFPIFTSEANFLKNISPTFGGETYQVPFPTLCPEERNRRRLMFRNESKIYRRTCDASGKPIISIYSPEKPYTVYHQNIWHSDCWNALDYGKDFDFTLSFNQQFKPLLDSVPKLGMQIRNAENSDYCCVANGARNCYLSNVCSTSEEAYYSSWVAHSKEVIDCLRCFKVENSYNAVGCTHSYNLQYCISCSHSSDCLFSFQLDGCSNCLLCSNLVNKQYCYKNQQYTKEEYKQKLAEYYTDEILQVERLKEEFRNLLQNSIFHQNNNSNSVDSIGSFVVDSNNTTFAFDVMTGENCMYYFDAGGEEKFCRDCSYGGFIEKAYESLSPVGYGIYFSSVCRGSSNIWYSESCIDCQNCFGCVGLKNKSYCILNKQYTKEEYEMLVPQIIRHMKRTGEWGEFFDPTLSPFGYNETVNQEYYPLSKEEAINQGYTWMDQEYAVNIPQGIGTIEARDLPLSSHNAPENLLSKAIICEVSGKPFRIVGQELEFYRRHNLPLPRKHPDIRHEERTKLRPQRNLHLRTCDKCHIEMLSVYDSNFTGKVYCESCYKKEMYS